MEQLTQQLERLPVEKVKIAQRVRIQYLHKLAQTCLKSKFIIGNGTANSTVPVEKVKIRIVQYLHKLTQSQTVFFSFCNDSIEYFFSGF